MKISHPPSRVDCASQPSHGEAIMTEDGPCLVEMNCRGEIWLPRKNTSVLFLDRVNTESSHPY